jgi:hypothetical protein
MASLYVLVYSFTMKYLVIIVVLVSLLRIDYIMELFDKVNQGFSTSSPGDIELNETNRELRPSDRVRSLKMNHKDIFFALLEDFHRSPQLEIRLKALDILKNNPSMFNEKLDPQLDSYIFRWRDLLSSNHPEVSRFLIDLLNILKGENLEMVRKFYSLWMDINMANFISTYSRSKDVNCTIAPLFGDGITEEEKLNEYLDREEALRAIILRENLEPSHRSLAEKCLLQISLLISKLTPPISVNDSINQIDPDLTPQVTP